MKINNHLNACLLAALCLSFPAVVKAADETGNTMGTGKASQTDKNQPGYRTYSTTEKGTTERIATSTGAPMVCNKASGLIGMEVRNQADEKLGRIKDIVIDLQAGKVSYAVLDGGTVFQSKLFAVPLSAFTTSSDDRYLILNAEKSKMETAQGFDKNAWPSVSNPDWGANTFWEKSPMNSDKTERNLKSGTSSEKLDRPIDPTPMP